MENVEWVETKNLWQNNAEVNTKVGCRCVYTKGVSSTKRGSLIICKENDSHWRQNHNVRLKLRLESLGHSNTEIEKRLDSTRQTSWKMSIKLQPINTAFKTNRIQRNKYIFHWLFRSIKIFVFWIYKGKLALTCQHWTTTEDFNVQIAQIKMSIYWSLIFSRQTYISVQNKLISARWNGPCLINWNDCRKWQPNHERRLV